jgi:hypothetical protein
MKFKTLLVVMGLLPLVGCGSASNDTSQEIIDPGLPNIEIPDEPSTGVNKSMLQWQFFPTDNPFAGDLTILSATISENVVSMHLTYDSEGYVAILEGSEVNENQQMIRNIRFKRYQDAFTNIGMLADRNALDGTITFDLSGETPSVSFDLVSEKDGVEIKEISASSWAGLLNEGLPVTLDALDIHPISNGGDFVYNGNGEFVFVDDSSGCSITGVARETSYLTMSKDNFYSSGSGHIFDFSILQENSSCDVGEEGKAGTIDISFSEQYTDIFILAPLHNYNVTYHGQVTHY